eukprot:TRINITY_DN15873_c1_g2_i1.p1 TRINITY_DN15873_c1_g2~~TRINITY_DN15873_c1_g2_i1.p1  ORF type:complete len:577 (-),score=89.85 TRINITY_DN15873_c1_g2_i1:421-2151(-)
MDSRGSSGSSQRRGRRTSRRKWQEVHSKSSSADSELVAPGKGAVPETTGPQPCKEPEIVPEFEAEADMACEPEVTPVHASEVVGHGAGDYPERSAVGETAGGETSTKRWGSPLKVLYDAMVASQDELGDALGEEEKLCFIERAKDATTYVQTRLSAIIRGSTTAPRLCAVKVQDGVSIVCCQVGEAIVVAKIWGVSASGFAVKSLGQASREIGIVLHPFTVHVHHAYSLSVDKLRPAVHPYVVQGRRGVAYISGTIDKMFVCVKANGDRARERALASFRGVQASLGGKLSQGKANLTSTVHASKTEVLQLPTLFRIKVRDGVLFLRCRVWDTSVLIKTSMSATASRAMETLSLSYAAVEGGCLYAMGTVEGVTVRCRAQIVETGTRVTVQAWSMIDRPRSDITLATGLIHEKAASLVSRARCIAADAGVQAVAKSATGGAVILGTTGGVAGLMTGGFVGATVGVVPALFTFGLSIPLGAAIGGGAGLCVGTVAGGSAGFFGGGVAAYGARTGGLQVANRVEVAKEYVWETATLSRDYLRDSYNAGVACARAARESELSAGDFAAGGRGNGPRGALA